MSSLGGQGSPGIGGGFSASGSPPRSKVTVPRLSLPEYNSQAQVSPRVPLSPRGAGPHSPSGKQKREPGSDQKGSPRFGPSGETPRDSARDSARASVRRRTEDSVNAYIMRRQSCNSTGKRSSAGSASKASTRRPNPLLSGNAKAETLARRRSPRDATPDHYPNATPATRDTTPGGTCSGAQGSFSANSTPARSLALNLASVEVEERSTRKVHRKSARTSSRHSSPSQFMRAVASSLSSLGAGDSHAPATHGDHEDPDVAYGATACSLSSLVAGDAHPIAAHVWRDDYEVIVDAPFMPAHPIHDLPVERRISADSRYSGDPMPMEPLLATAAARRMSADSRCSADVPNAQQRLSQSERTSQSHDSSAPQWAPSSSDEYPLPEPRRISSFRGGHKKTPSFTGGSDNGSRTARGVASPLYDDALQHLDRDRGDDENDLNAGNSTYARLEELTDKVQRLFVEVSSSLATPVPAQASMRPAMGPPSRPPRPPPASAMPLSVMPGYGCAIPPQMSTPVATPDGMTSFPSQVSQPEVAEEEIARLKFRVHHLELGLQRQADCSPSDSAACNEGVVALKKQLDDTRSQLVEAKDEIQQARVQIHLLAQRVNGMQPDDSALPLQTVTPRVLPAALVATPPVPGRACNVPLLPMTARAHQRPPSPSPYSGEQTLRSVASSPLPTARMQRQGSIAGSGNGSYAPPCGSYAPPAQRVLISTPCGSARASPHRTHPQPHPAACLVGTPPATARMCSSFVPPARGFPMKVGAMTAHMMAIPPHMAVAG